MHVRGTLKGERFDVSLGSSSIVFFDRYSDYQVQRSDGSFQLFDEYIGELPNGSPGSAFTRLSTDGVDWFEVSDDDRGCRGLSRELVSHRRGRCGLRSALSRECCGAAPIPAKEFHTVDPSLASPDEVLIKREDRAELDDLTLAILERLDERERKIAALHSHGLARNDIARHLGITARIVKRDVEAVLATATTLS